ncbi:hypothetical protein EV715DRAFT_277092 [Schizophyllum commune]
MRFSLAVAPALFFGFAAAAVTHSEKRDVTDPTNPQNLINCPPGGGADGCHLETKCDRIRINYGYSFNGHYIWWCSRARDQYSLASFMKKVGSGKSKTVDTGVGRSVGQGMNSSLSTGWSGLSTSGDAAPSSETLLTGNPAPPTIPPAPAATQLALPGNGGQPRSSDSALDTADDTIKDRKATGHASSSSGDASQDRANDRKTTKELALRDGLALAPERNRGDEALDRASGTRNRANGPCDLGHRACNSGDLACHGVDLAFADNRDPASRQSTVTVIEGLQDETPVVDL